jgi:hypothetical protein
MLIFFKIKAMKKWSLKIIFYSTYSIRGSHLFTASGAQYFHLFNISLCGKAPAQCFNNVSYQMDGQTSQVSTH